MEQFIVNAIGRFHCDETGYRLQMYDPYRKALQGLDGFSHINILWWFSQSDCERDRTRLFENTPYRNAPESLGVFATRSPRRPNPIALTCAQITHIDHEKGVVGITYTDAFDGSPVLDIKPYTPSLDRVQSPAVPGWCASWPKSLEESGDFDWGSVFRF